LCTPATHFHALQAVTKGVLSQVVDSSRQYPSQSGIR
jgi:hypothetical protein